MSTRLLAPILLALALLPAAANAQITVRSSAAATVAGVTPARDQFRTDLGGGTVAGANGSFGGLRREINWDGVPAAFSAPNLFPPTFFNTTSPRGAEFSTPGTSFMVSGATADAGAGQPAAANFGNIDPAYTAGFAPFTAQRLFTPRGSNITDVRFFLPGTSTPASVSGFGVMFSDVDQAGTTALQFFDAQGVSLGAFAASPGAFSFLGMFINDLSPRIARVRITCGTTALNPGAVDAAGVDVVAMDDFLYGEPAVPGACCHGLTCTLVANTAACTSGGAFLGAGVACSAPTRQATINACCPTDFDATGYLSIQDIFAFLNAWFASCP